MIITASADSIVEVINRSKFLLPGISCRYPLTDKEITILKEHIEKDIKAVQEKLKSNPMVIASCIQPATLAKMSFDTAVAMKDFDSIVSAYCDFYGNVGTHIETDNVQKFYFAKFGCKC